MTTLHAIHRGGRANDGYSLVELTAAMFVLTVGLFGVFRLFHFGIDRMRTIEEAAIAAQAVQNELEVVRTTSFGMLQDGERAFSEPNPALEQLRLAETKVTIAPARGGVADLKQVDVSIRWVTEHGRRAERSVTTLIGEKSP